MVEIDYKTCDGCCTCISVCPVDALIFMDRIELQDGRCIGCSKCVKVCPVGALSLKGARDV